MALNHAEVRAVVASHLTREEEEHGVAYAADEAIAAGAELQFPGVELAVPWEAVLVFIDRQPIANWGHSARYLLVRRGVDEAVSVEARLPPFGARPSLTWLVAYQAPGVPDTALAVRNHPRPD